MGANTLVAADLVFVGFNSRIAALHRETGQLMWQWKSPKGSRYVALLLDQDRLIASVMGYTYCLDPLTGQELWRNELPGFGTGVTCLASVNGNVNGAFLNAIAEEIQRQQAASSAAVH